MQFMLMLGNKQGLNSNSCRSGLIKTLLTIGFTIDLRGLHRIIYTTDRIQRLMTDCCLGVKSQEVHIYRAGSDCQQRHIAAGIF